MCRGGNSLDRSKANDRCTDDNYDGLCDQDTVDQQCCRPADQIRCGNGGANGATVAVRHGNSVASDDGRCSGSWSRNISKAGAKCTDSNMNGLCDKATVDRECCKQTTSCGNGGPDGGPVSGSIDNNETAMPGICGQGMVLNRTALDVQCSDGDLDGICDARDIESTCCKAALRCDNGYNGSSVRGQALSGELLKDSRAQGHCSPGKVPNPQKATELCANRDDNDKCDAAGIDYTCCDNATKRPYCYSHLCTACPDGQSLDQKTNACREAKCPALSTIQRRFTLCFQDVAQRAYRTFLPAS